MQAASVSGDTGPPSGPAKDLLKPETLTGFSSRVLSYLFAVHSGLCDQKFELKVSEVRFIGHAMSLEVNQDEARFVKLKKLSITYLSYLTDIVSCLILNHFFLLSM